MLDCLRKCVYSSNPRNLAQKTKMEEASKYNIHIFVIFFFISMNRASSLSLEKSDSLSSS